MIATSVTYRSLGDGTQLVSVIGLTGETLWSGIAQVGDRINIRTSRQGWFLGAHILGESCAATPTGSF
jgi:hypothetical protein